MQPVTATNERWNVRIEGRVFTGTGKAVVRAVAEHAGIDSLAVLADVVSSLLVAKGADWTSVIANEYLELYEDSRGTFSLVWDDATGQLVAHGSVFQSAACPWAALLAHIRTRDGFKGLGLGTLVTDQVTRAALAAGAGIVVLATDDKIHRVDQGERAAHSMYSRMGYAILGETRLADTVDWLMAIDPTLQTAADQHRTENDGQLAKVDSAEMVRLKADFVSSTRDRFTAPTANATIKPVTAGDLAGLFLLMNLCPADDFRLKLTSWHVHHGPELERTFIATLRQAIVDQDRLQDASLVLRDAEGRTLAVCAAQQVAPFTRRTYGIDFYALPAFVANNADRIRQLVEATIHRVRQSPLVVRPCALSFMGTDPAKVELMQSLGFAATGHATMYHDAASETPTKADEYQLAID
ncbi:GNAT family N-acetyltransferase [Aeoliella sp. ICT_H6.2]|uniref:GNAT family N-acetyltransferase n=2 Tax=Aeoliella straminimaris TaxID=2954799 RepID=A0A9X2JJK6_9BACT|nr:GNAT family N-acetyltransferase [Aeoliella straminimaris]